MNTIRTIRYKRLFALAAVAFMVASPLMTMALPMPGHLSPDPAITGPGPVEPQVSRGYVDEGEWSMFQSDPANTGLTTSPVPDTNSTIWSVDMGETLSTSPTVANNTLYGMTAGATLFAVNASTGLHLWSRDIGTWSNTTPALLGPMVLAGADDGTLVALNVTSGQEEWSVDTGSPVVTDPVVANDTVYFGTGDGTVWAYNRTGAHVWNTSMPASLTGSPALSEDLLVVSVQGEIHALNATDGTNEWNDTVTGPILSTPLITGGPETPSTWLVHLTTEQDRIHTFSMMDGTPGWTGDVLEGGFLPPAATDDMVLVATGDLVMGFNRTTGSWMWNHTARDNLTAPVASNGTTMLLATEAGLEAVPFDSGGPGTPVWTHGATPSAGVALAYGRAFSTTTAGMVTGYGHRPTAIIDDISPDPVNQGEELVLTGHGTGAAAFRNFRWTSSIDGLIAQGSKRSTARATSLSLGHHIISFQVQDDNWTWSEEVGSTADVDPSPHWPMFGQNTHRTATNNVSVPNNNGTRWITDLRDPNEGDIISSPVVHGDTVFVGSRDYFIHALNLTTGRDIWTYKTGGAVFSTATYNDGYIYFGSDDRNLYCMDADPSDGNDEGEIDYGAEYDLVWTFEANGPVWASPAVVNGVAYFTTTPPVNQDDPNPGRLYAVDTSPGALDRELWHFTLPNNAPAYSSPVVYRDMVIFGANDNHVYAVNRTSGQEEWNLTTGDSVWSSPAIWNDTVYIGSDDNRIYALYASNGSVKWSQPTGGPIQTSPALSGGQVFVTGDDDKLHVYDAVDGTEEWTFTTGDLIKSSPSVAGDQVVFGSFDGHIYVVNTTSHNLHWKRDIGYVAQSSAAIVKDIIVIGASKGKVYAFGKAPDLALDPDDITFSLSTPQVGVPVGIKAKVVNKGSLPGNGTVSFYDDQQLLHSSFVDLVPGEVVNLSLKWTPTTPGNHIITVNISDVRPHDSISSNNKVLKTVNVLEETVGWRMFQKDEGHSGTIDVPTPNNNKVLWSYDFSGPISSSPVSADQLIFIGGEGGIRAMVENPGQGTGIVFWSNSSITDVEATAAVVGGIVYVPSMDGTLYAIDAWNGRTLWTAAINTGRSSPIVVNNTLVIGTADGRVAALNALNGTPLWNSELGGRITASPTYHEGAVIVGNVDGTDSKVQALSGLNGSVLWTLETGYPVRSAAAVDQDGEVYVGDSNGTIYKLEAIPDFKDDGISNTGDYDLLWKYHSGMAMASTPAVSGNNIYATIGNTSLVSLTATGELNWQRVYSEDTDSILSTSPTVATNKIFLGGDKIYCLDTSTGLEVWSYETGSTVSSPAAITLGKVYFNTDGGIVYAFANITPQEPRAVISSPADTEFRTGEEITFDATGSTDDGLILTYEWDFGDGNQDDEAVTTHSYESTGNYTVTLTVKDNEIPPLVDNETIVIHIRPNAEPLLTQPSVSPRIGNLSTVFNFSVYYSDPDNDPPAFVKVVVSGQEHEMEKVDPLIENHTLPVRYYCSTSLPSDNHTYTFRASDGVLEAPSVSGDGLKVWQVATFVKDEITVEMRFVGQGQVVIELPTLPPKLPEGLVNKDMIRISVEGVSEWSWMHLIINGSGRDITSNVIPETLEMNWYDGTAWVPLETELDLAEPLAEVNVSFNHTPHLGIFALFGEPMAKNVPPTIDSVEVSDKRPDVNDKIMVTIQATDEEGDQLYYQFNWGDGSAVTNWTTNDTASHKFTKAKTYTVRVFVTDDPSFTNQTRIDERSVEITVREEGSSEALIALAVIIVIALLVIFAVPIKGGPEEEVLDDEEPIGEDEEISDEEETEGEEE